MGRALVQILGARHDLVPLERNDLDVSGLNAVRETVGRIQPDWIVHAAAYTRVDDAEREPEAAWRTNALGSRNVAAAAREAGAAMLYYSTDYVFDGRSRRPYSEWDATVPLNVYGRSKLGGEQEVRHLCPAHLIVRTSWLFGPGGSHFVGKILEHARHNRPLRVIDDQVGSPTYTLDLAAASLQLLDANARGIFHVTNSGSCSWYELACTVLELAGLEVPISPIPTSEFPTPATRPAYTVLGRSCFEAIGAPPLRPWQEAVADFLERDDV